MRLKERARKLKIDIPALFLALKAKDTPMLAKIFAGITMAFADSSDLESASVNQTIKTGL